MSSEISLAASSSCCQPQARPSDAQTAPSGPELCTRLRDNARINTPVVQTGTQERSPYQLAHRLTSPCFLPLCRPSLEGSQIPAPPAPRSPSPAPRAAPGGSAPPGSGWVQSASLEIDARGGGYESRKGKRGIPDRYGFQRPRGLNPRIGHSFDFNSGLAGAAGRVLVNLAEDAALAGHAHHGLPAPLANPRDGMQQVFGRVHQVK